MLPWVFRAGRYFSSNPWTAMNLADDVVGTQNAWVMSPFVAYQAARAPLGDKVDSFVSGAAALAALPSMASATTWALRLVAPTLGGPIGAITVGLAGILISGEANSWLRNSVHRSLRRLREDERHVYRLEMGGWYSDNGVAQAMRYGALAEMSGAHQTARTYLGREGAILHR